MSRFIQLAAAALALCAVFTTQARPLEDIRKSGTIVLGTEGSYEPFSFVKHMQLTGYEVEVAQAVVERMGFEVKWEITDFEKLLPGLDKNQWDVALGSHTITAERAKIATFGLPHYCTGAQIVSMTPEISKATDLAGKIVAAQKDTTYVAAAQKVPGVKQINELASSTAARNALIARSADAWVTDYFIAWEMQSQAEMLGFHLGDVLFVEQIAAAFALGNQPLADAWNKALREVMQDGTVVAISHKYFKQDIRCK